MGISELCTQFHSNLCSDITQGLSQDSKTIHPTILFWIQKHLSKPVWKSELGHYMSKFAKSEIAEIQVFCKRKELNCNVTILTRDTFTCLLDGQFKKSAELKKIQVIFI